jgi:hypothetical protein
MDRQNRFVEDYVRHLPEVGPELPDKPGVRHVVLYHDDDCRIFEGQACNCEPDIRFFAEPSRS